VVVDEEVGGLLTEVFNRVRPEQVAHVSGPFDGGSLNLSI